ncbi:MAG: JAB domain-containing protein [Chlorobi bacterium]|nr:JAB domain-containing protein [Chlorobiota bacterium]
MKVKELPSEDRPREKLILRGAKNLSDAELIAILLRTGLKGKSVVLLAQEIILKFGNVALLAGKTIPSLTKIKGVGKDKAATLAAAFELARRISSTQKWFSNKEISSPQDVADIFIPLLRDEQQEHFLVVCLNSANKIIKHETVFVGSLSSTTVHPREIFKRAIDNNSANIILIHNHPSGNIEPSAEDKLLTKKLVEAGKLLEIQIFDHIIIGNNNYSSFVERNLM